MTKLEKVLGKIKGIWSYIIPVTIIYTSQNLQSQENTKKIFDEYKNDKKIVQEINNLIKDFTKEFDSLSSLERKLTEKLTEYKQIESEKEKCKGKINQFKQKYEENENKIKELNEIVKKYNNTNIAKAAEEEIKKIEENKKVYDDSIRIYGERFKDLEREIGKKREEGENMLEEFKKKYGGIKERMKLWRDFYEKLKAKEK